MKMQKIREIQFGVRVRRFSGCPYYIQFRVRPPHGVLFEVQNIGFMAELDLREGFAHSCLSKNRRVGVSTCTTVLKVLNHGRGPTVLGHGL
jgi:hypothetical protein